MTTEETPQPAATSRRSFLRQAGAAAAVGAAAVGTIGYIASQRVGTTDTLVAGYHAGDLPIDDPLHDLWRDRSAFVAKMLAQNITTPLQTTVEVAELRVRALHNGTTLAFHLQWSDTTEDDAESIAEFRDAVAVQLEVDPATTPAFTMGHAAAAGTPAGPVHILQWRASWQADIDHGHQGVKQLFPNAYNDTKPETLMSKEQAIVFYPARGAKNALAEHDRKSPVEELTAIGFGTLTSHDKQNATGRGVYRSRQWNVVVALPMAPGDRTKATIAAGETRNAAFAVWNGSKGQRGARKQYFPWTPMTVEASA